MSKRHDIDNTGLSYDSEGSESASDDEDREPGAQEAVNASDVDDNAALSAHDTMTFDEKGGNISESTVKFIFGGMIELVQVYSRRI